MAILAVSSPNKARRRWLQFRLRSLLLAVVPVAVVAAWVGDRVRNRNLVRLEVTAECEVFLRRGLPADEWEAALRKQPALWQSSGRRPTGPRGSSSTRTPPAAT